ncbi:MAG: DUF86 domain-containing protein [bacterium]
MKNDKLYLIHISECIERIEQYVSGGKDEFLDSTLIQDAVLRNLQTLAESTQRISSSLKATYPHVPYVPWKDISGFRNILVHDYLGLDLENIWQVVECELPPLKQQINAIIRK